VPHVHVPQPGQAVNVFAALGILDDRAFTLDPNLGLLVRTGMVKRMQQMGLIGLNAFADDGHGMVSFVSFELMPP
jgi:hypothetical protein